MAGRRLKLLGLVGVAREVAVAVGVGRGQPQTTELGSREVIRIGVVVRVAIIGVAFQADLVLARHDRGAHQLVGVGARVAALDGEVRRHRLKRIVGVDRLDTGRAAQHAGDGIAVHIAGSIFMAVGARLLICIGKSQGARQPVLPLDDPVRVVAIGAFSVAIGQIVQSKLGSRFKKILAALAGDLAAIGIRAVVEYTADVMHFRAGQLLGTLDRHMPAQAKIRFNVRNRRRARSISYRRIGDGGVALKAGFFERSVAPGLGGIGEYRAVRTFAQQTPRTLYRMRVVAVQTADLPYRRIGVGWSVQRRGKFTQLRRQRLVGLRRHLAVGMRRKSPRGASLVVAGQADGVAGGAERAACRLRHLEAVHAQEFGVAIAGGFVAQMRIVAG